MQTNENEKISPETPAGVIHVRDLKSARRLFTRVLDLIQADTIEERKAKTLIYGLKEFTAVFKDSDLQDRLERLENQIGNGVNNDN